jgi:hypothetical protein
MTDIMEVVSFPKEPAISLFINITLLLLASREEDDQETDTEDQRENLAPSIFAHNKLLSTSVFLFKFPSYKTQKRLKD